MGRFDAKKIIEMAEKYEAKINDPSNRDDPRWLQKHANALRKWAAQRLKGFKHKQRQKSKS